MQSYCGQVLPPAGSLHISSVCFHQKLLKPSDTDRISPQQSFIRNMRIKTGRLVSTIISCCRFLNHHTNLSKQLVFVLLLICSVNVVNTQHFLLSVSDDEVSSRLFLCFLNVFNWTGGWKRSSRAEVSGFFFFRTKTERDVLMWKNSGSFQQISQEWMENQWMTQWWHHVVICTNQNAHLYLPG